MASQETLLSIPPLGVLANDTDDDPLTAQLASGPLNGTLLLNADGSFNYTPDEDFAGVDSFTYRASDGGFLSNAATVRNGCCDTGPEDRGRHTVCVRVTVEFLAFSYQRGNDLSTPRPEFGFAGLSPGDRWCLCADRWKEALDAGVAPKVVLASTHRSVLRTVPLEVLQENAMPGRTPLRH